MHFLPLLLGTCLVGSCGYYLACLLAASLWRRANTPTHPYSITPPLSILKPLHGADPEQAANFETFCGQDYPEYQLVFGALDPADAGLEAARALAARWPECDITVVAGGETFGHNRKVCNLANMLPAAKHDLLVLCDSDMRVGPDYLRRVAAPFDDPAVGLVTCPYRGCEARGLASQLEALGIGADFIPSAFTAWYLTGLRFAFGSTIAIRREALEQIGGFAALADELADDFLLADRVHKAGWAVALSDYVVDDVLGREAFGEMWARRLRWAKTSRAMRPGPYAGAFITHGTALGVLFLAACGCGPAGWAGLAAVFAVRATVATIIARRYTDDPHLPRLLWLLPLSDLMSAALYVCSFFGRTITWRGERFILLPGGRLRT